MVKGKFLFLKFKKTAVKIRLNLFLIIFFGLLAMPLAADVPALDPQDAYSGSSMPVLRINLIGFDAITGDLKARLCLKLPRQEIGDRFAPLSNYYLVDLLAVNGVSHLAVKSDVLYSAYNNYVSTVYEVENAGALFLYPFDSHRTKLQFFVQRETVTPDGPSLKTVPAELDSKLCSFEGYKVTLTPGKNHSPSFVDLTVGLYRTIPIKCYCVFISLLMLFVSGSAARMTIKRLNSKTAPEVGEFAFCAALLFAFPAIRNTQPFVPPMGVLSDYLGFFWAESAAAISLIVQVEIWLKRKTFTS